MASATGIPSQSPAVHASEDEPLLGRPGDAAQGSGGHILTNLYIGTGVLAQAGAWVLTAVVWAGIFSNDLMLFSAHPLLNSAGIFLVTQAILILQPTHTPLQKHQGTLLHAGFHALGLSALLAGLIVIEVNKFAHDGTHFVSPHAILGLITYVFMGLQAVVGVTQYWTPGIYGGEERAKKVWKWHRGSGYGVLTLGLATVAAATRTDFNVNALHIQLWAVLVSAVLVLVGVLPRVKLQKLGLKR